MWKLIVNNYLERQQSLSSSDDSWEMGEIDEGPNIIHVISILNLWL